MIIRDCLPEDVKISFTQETMDNSTRMIQFGNYDNLFEFYCTIEQAKKFANQLLESVITFENKWVK